MQVVTIFVSLHIYHSFAVIWGKYVEINTQSTYFASYPGQISCRGAAFSDARYFALSKYVAHFFV